MMNYAIIKVKISLILPLALTFPVAFRRSIWATNLEKFAAIFRPPLFCLPSFRQDSGTRKKAEDTSQPSHTHIVGGMSLPSGCLRVIDFWFVSGIRICHDPVWDYKSDLDLRVNLSWQNKSRQTWVVLVVWYPYSVLVTLISSMWTQRLQERESSLRLSRTGVHFWVFCYGLRVI